MATPVVNTISLDRQLLNINNALVKLNADGFDTKTLAKKQAVRETIENAAGVIISEHALFVDQLRADRSAWNKWTSTHTFQKLMETNPEVQAKISAVREAATQLFAVTEAVIAKYAAALPKANEALVLARTKVPDAETEIVAAPAPTGSGCVVQ